MWRDAAQVWARYIFAERMAGRVSWPPLDVQRLRDEHEYHLKRVKEIEVENARKRAST